MNAVVEMVVTGPVDAMERIAATLVNERLIACAHLSPINSVYRWRGTVERAEETRASLHTTESLAEAVTRRIKGLHPYEVPCVLTLAATGGNPEYLQWVSQETLSSGTHAPRAGQHE